MRSFAESCCHCEVARQPAERLHRSTGWMYDLLSDRNLPKPCRSSSILKYNTCLISPFCQMVCLSSTFSSFHPLITITSSPPLATDQLPPLSPLIFPQCVLPLISSSITVCLCSFFLFPPSRIPSSLSVPLLSSFILSFLVSPFVLCLHRHLFSFPLSCFLSLFHTLVFSFSLSPPVLS